MGAYICMSLPWVFIDPWWRHQMETFPASLAFCAGNSPVPSQSQWRGALLFSLICAWTNGWINNREAGDLSHHHVHHDVTIMLVTYQTGSEQTFTYKLRGSWCKYVIAHGKKNITAMSHEHHGVLNHRFDCLFNRLWKLTAKREQKLSITDPFVWGIHRWPMDFPHKSSVLLKNVCYFVPLRDGVMQRVYMYSYILMLEKRYRLKYLRRLKWSIVTNVILLDLIECLKVNYFIYQHQITTRICMFIPHIHWWMII